MLYQLSYARVPLNLSLPPRAGQSGGRYDFL